MGCRNKFGMTMVGFGRTVVGLAGCGYVSATVVIPNLFRNLLRESMGCRNKFGMMMVGFGMTMVRFGRPVVGFGRPVVGLAGCGWIGRTVVMSVQLLSFRTCFGISFWKAWDAEINSA